MTFYEKEIERIKNKYLFPAHIYKKLKEAKTFIDCNYSQLITLDKMARVAGVSKFRFVRLFKLTYGLTPNSYLKQVRVAQAKKLLKTKHTLSQASIAVGYESLSTFSGLFKKITGINASAYKQKAILKKL